MRKESFVTTASNRAVDHLHSEQKELRRQPTALPTVVWYLRERQMESGCWCVELDSLKERIHLLGLASQH